jgi:hypothetical protein
VSKHFRLEVSSESAGVEVAAALPGGDPFIVTAPLGRGRMVLVSTDASLSSVDQATGEPWTAWPTWPSFLPVVREILAYAVSGQRAAWDQPVGTPLAPRGGELLSAVSGVAKVEVQRPDGSTAAAQIEQAIDGDTWSYDRTDQCGVYQVKVAGSETPQSFAVNVDTRESDLAKVDLQRLPEVLQVRSRPQSSGEQVAGDLVARAGWQQPLLATALGLVLMESLLAWQFGRGTR